MAAGHQESVALARPRRRSPELGVLVVHGIGRQLPGDTVDGFCDGLKSVYSSEIAVERLERPRPETRIVHGPVRSAAIVEVHWADLLDGELVKGTFRIDEVHQMTWFPSLNLEAGSLPPSMRDDVRAWTRRLVLVSAMLFPVFYLLDVLAILTTNLRPLKVVRATEEWRQMPFRERIRTARHVTNWFDLAKDDVAGDVFNYARGSAHAFALDPDENPPRSFGEKITWERAAQICESVERIHDRFEDAAEQLAALGCEEIQVIAHSLGSVIAWRAMTTHVGAGTPASRSPAPARLTRFTTIGSPLNKVRFFWPSLVTSEERTPSIVDGEGRVLAAPPTEAPLVWRNLYCRSDVVSGELGRFNPWPEPQNEQMSGLGGVITAHTAYLTNPVFLTEAGTEILGQPPARHAKPSSLAKRLGNRAQGLVLPLVILAAVVAGFALIGGLGYVSGLVFGVVARWAGADGLAVALPWVMALYMLLFASLGLVVLGRRSATAVHEHLWSATEERRRDEPGRIVVGIS